MIVLAFFVFKILHGICKMIRNQFILINMVRYFTFSFFIFLLYFTPVFGQLNCKTSVNAQSGKEKKCFHRNGKISTLEVWDKTGREGNMKGFDPWGKELFSYGLRSFAGHSSVYTTYYANGQLQKAEYSSAPDGGIQYYRIIHYFDEQGHETGRQDLSRPDGMEVLWIYQDTVKRETPKEVETPVATVKKAEYLTVFKLVNETDKQVEVELKSIGFPLRDTIVKLERRATLVIDSVYQTSFLEYKSSYQLEARSGKKQKAHKIILAIPDEANKRRIYTWHVLK